MLTLIAKPALGRFFDASSKLCTESHEISRHRVHCCPRHQARRVEMVDIGCGHVGIGQRAEQSSGGKDSREDHRSGSQFKNGATCLTPTTSTTSLRLIA